MRLKYLIILALLAGPAFAAEDLSHITGAGGTVFFDCDFESGYQYLGAGNAHSGGGYFYWLGGSPLQPEGLGCSNVDNYHNTVISNDSAAQGAVPGSQYALKTPYDGDCPGESFQRDTTIIYLGQEVPEVYVRWYQKWTSDWNSSSVQQKFIKFCGAGYAENPYRISAQFSFGPSGECWRSWVNNYNGQFSHMGPYTSQPQVWIYQTESGAGNWGWDDINNGIGIGGTDSESCFETERWYCIEIHAKTNSSPDSYDAELQAWIDGVRVFELKNFQLYTGGQAAYGTRYLEFQHVYYNRSATNQPTYMDNIVIADRYIGPMDYEPSCADTPGLCESQSACETAGWNWCDGTCQASACEEEPPLTPVKTSTWNVPGTVRVR